MAAATRATSADHPGTGARASVERWRRQAEAAHARYPDIPVSTLLGLTEVESGGQLGLTSSAGARGLDQFMPRTAAQYHVGSDPQSQLLGAAHYLHDLGYARNPNAALAQYNAGPAPGYMQRAGRYPQQVLGAAHKYGSPYSAAGASTSGSIGTAGGISIGNPLGGIDAIGAFFAALLDPHTWARIGKIALGGLLIVFAVFEFGSQSKIGAQVVTNVKRGAAAAAAV